MPKARRAPNRHLGTRLLWSREDEFSLPPRFSLLLQKMVNAVGSKGLAPKYRFGIMIFDLMRP